MPTKCLEYLESPREQAIPAIVVAFGDEDFLRRQALKAVRESLLGPEYDDFTYSERPGDEVALADVLDELATPPFLGEHRMVVVYAADKFVSAHREKLQAYLDRSSATGVLFLDLRTWESRTNLYKKVEQAGLAIDCKALPPAAVADWCVRWIRLHHGATMTRPAAQWLVELVGPSLGMLDQELEKLATSAGPDQPIDPSMVDRLVSASRVETAFKVLEMVFTDDVAGAIVYLRRAFLAGESPVGILAMMLAQLRKLTKASREILAGAPMEKSLAAAGIPPFAIGKSVAQLRHLGKERMLAMYRFLLRADLHLKGGTAIGEQAVLERVLIELSRKAPVPARHQPA